MHKMGNAYKPLWFLFVLVLSVAVVTVISRARAPKDNIPWRTDVPAARAESRESGKPMLVYFMATWCGACQHMKRTTWGDPAVDARLRADYVPVKIDVDANPGMALRYDVRTLPMIIVLDEEGAVERQANAALPADEFLAWLDAAEPL